MPQKTREEKLYQVFMYNFLRQNVLITLICVY